MANLPPIYCPNCNKRYRLPASFQDRMVECKKCQHRFRVIHDSESEDTTDDANEIASIFDSLDVDVLLNSPAPVDQRPSKDRPRKSKPARTEQKSKRNQPSKLKADKPSAKQNRPLTRPVQSPATNPPSEQTGDGRWKTSPPQATQPSATTSATTSAPPANPAANDSVAPPNPDLIQEELEFAWAKKERANQQDTPSEDRSQTSDTNIERRPATSVEHEMDEEELAIYEAVTWQNRTRNFAAAVIVALICVLVGGYFAAAEVGNLNTPLTNKERAWLTDQGFVLKVRRAAAEVDGRDDGSVVTLIAGRDFSDIDQFPKEPDDNAVGDNQLEARPDARNPIARLDRIDRQPFGNRLPDLNGRREQPKRPEPKVDIDTNNDRRPDAKPIQVAFELKIPQGDLVTLSPRGQFYTASRKFVTGLNAKGDIFEKRSLDKQLETATATLATPDGRRLIIGHYYGRFQSFLLDSKGRLTEEAEFNHIHQKKIIALATSDDSKLLAVYSEDHRLSVWNLETKQIEMSVADLKTERDVQSFHLHNGQVLITDRKRIHRISLSDATVDREAFDALYRLAAVDPFGKNILFGDSRRIGVFDADTRDLKWSRWVSFHGNARVKFSPDLETAFFYDGGRQILQLNISDGKTVNRYEVPNWKNVRDVKISVDGKTMLANCSREERYLFEIPGGRSATPLALKAALPLPKREAVKDIPLDPTNPKPLKTADVTPERLTAAVLCDDGYLAVSDRLNRIVVYDWFTDKVVDEHFDDGNQNITTLAFVNGQLAVGRRNGVVELIPIEDGGKLGTPQNITKQFDEVSFILSVPATSHLVSVTKSGRTHVVDLKTKKTIYDGKPISSNVSSVIVDANSEILLSSDRELVMLQYEAGTTRVKRGERAIRNATLLPDGKRLAFFDGQKLKLSTTARGDVNLTIDLTSFTSSVSFSPDSKLAFVFSKNLAMVYRIRGGVGLFNFPLQGQSAFSTKMLFTPDGKFMTPFSPSTGKGFKIYSTPKL